MLIYLYIVCVILGGQSWVFQQRQYGPAKAKMFIWLFTGKKKKKMEKNPLVFHGTPSMPFGDI